MPSETAHHPSGPLVLALSLAATAGFIDAHLFLYVTNVFVANMSGNMVRLGIDAGDGEWLAAIGPAVALTAFATGVVVAITYHDRRLRAGQRVRPDELLVVEAALALALPLLIIGFHVDFSAHARPAHILVIAVGALAMGIQASSLRRVGEIAVATTYGTGTIVRIGEKIALALRKAERNSDIRRLRTIVLLIVVLNAYVAGAAIASASGSSPLLLLGPPAILMTFAIYIRHDETVQAAFLQSRQRLRRRPTVDY